MSSIGLEQIIAIGNNFSTRRYSTIATTAIFFYDYFLTLSDEINYAWRGRKSWVFVIFVLNRYLPVGYQIWLLYVNYSTTYHKRLYECEKTAFIEILVGVMVTLFAQVVITMRIYAVTRKNLIIASCFCVITISQLVLGLYVTVDTAQEGALPIPLPLPVFMMCTFKGHLSGEIGFIAMSLAYDVLAFSVIVYLVVRSNVDKVPIPSLLKTIVQDATYYFLVIFTSHFVLVMFLAFASDSIKLLPASGTLVFLPVMVTRLLLSLKKASASREQGWSLGEPTTHTTMKFVDRQGGISTKDIEIPLGTFSSSQETTQSQEWRREGEGYC